MKLLLDESIPKSLKAVFPDHFEIDTVQEAGWAGTKNGELLGLVRKHNYSALITADRGIAHQQNAAVIEVIVVVLAAFRTHVDHLSPFVPDIVTFLEGKPENGVHIFGE